MVDGDAGKSGGLPLLRPANLREQAKSLIHAQIVTGGVAPGQIYPVGHFSSQLGVSATPVREALLDLANQGLVELVRNRGFRIVELSEGDLDEIFELRMILEVHAIRQAVGRLSAADLASCVALAKENEAQAVNRDLAGFLLSDRELHLRMLAPVANRRLVEFIAQLRDQVRLPGLRSLADSGALTAAAQEHFGLVDALVSGSVEEAESRLRAHLQHTRGIWAGRTEPSG
ncbi:MAG TPA: GntR family transcriptional regulator [Gaiellaceae bacterium]|nr:GntR family transcriptional regulator [Gaiellaceae bacterium]